MLALPREIEFHGSGEVVTSGNHARHAPQPDVTRHRVFSWTEINTARSSIGKDTALSRPKEGFESPTSHCELRVQCPELRVPELRADLHQGHSQPSTLNPTQPGRSTVKDAALIRRKRRFDSFPSYCVRQLPHCAVGERESIGKSLRRVRLEDREKRG